MKLPLVLNVLLVAALVAACAHPVALAAGAESEATLYATSQVSMGALVLASLLFLVRRFACDG